MNKFKNRDHLHEKLGFSVKKIMIFLAHNLINKIFVIKVFFFEDKNIFYASGS